VTLAVGLFALGLVLGWAALFVRPVWWRGSLGQLGWAVALALVVALAPDPRVVAAGIAVGLAGHLTLLAAVRERRA
jgi:hypothetical protein